MVKNYQPIEWLGNKVRILDQTRLPAEEVYLEITSYRDIVSAIVELKVRGAPAIGVVGGYGMALGALKIEVVSRKEYLEKINNISDALAATRPTAKNLFWVLDRMGKVAANYKDVAEIKIRLVEEAIKIHSEEVDATRKLSQLGADLIRDGFTILTHCNTGPLATTGYGTALGVIIWAKNQGKNIRVFASETRPLLQGARLTTWELKKANVPVTLVTDSMAGYIMNKGDIDCVIVGADRIAANGDTANKIGTYTLAVLAKENGVPFYVAAPTSTIDPMLASGREIPIEERKSIELTHTQGVRITPKDIEVFNPAFDITPHDYITAIINENGIAKKPYRESIGGIL